MDKRKLLRNIDICEEVITYIDKNIEDVCKRNEYIELLNQLKKLADSTYAEIKMIENQGLLLPNIGAAFGNMSYSIGRIMNHTDKFERIFNYDIYESLERMKILTNCQYNIIDSKENMIIERERLENELRKLHNIPKKKYKYKVSIMVPAYNQLEYTKRTIESIYKYTDFSKGTVELITLNNGSTDETEIFFESLPHEKKFSFKYNTLPFHISSRFYEGEYLIIISNDVLVTPGWLDLMIACMESANDIGMVVPTCNEDSISLMQGIKISYENKLGNEKSVEVFAREYNSPNEKLWEERSLLMPFVSMVRSDLWSLGIEDPSFIKGQFIDDDYSTLLRRTRWRMILAKNVFMHHYGSITYNDDKTFSYSDALLQMRKVYADKWGVDAWLSRGIICTRYYIPDYQKKSKIKILWVEPKFGVNYLQVKHQYLIQGIQDVESVAVVIDKKYSSDAKGLFDDVVIIDDFTKWLSKNKKGFDFIGFGCYIDEIIDQLSLNMISALKGTLTDDGNMVVPIMNYYNYKYVSDWFVGMANAKDDHYINMDEFMSDISREITGSNNQFLAVYNGGVGVGDREAEIIKMIFASNRKVSEIKEMLNVYMWWLIVKK